jgi:hypothetical protein
MKKVPQKLGLRSILDVVNKREMSGSGESGRSYGGNWVMTV